MKINFDIDDADEARTYWVVEKALEEYLHTLETAYDEDLDNSALFKDMDDLFDFVNLMKKKMR